MGHEAFSGQSLPLVKLLSLVVALGIAACGGSPTEPTDVVAGPFSVNLSVEPPAGSILPVGTSYRVSWEYVNYQSLPPHASVMVFIRDDGAMLGFNCSGGLGGSQGGIESGGSQGGTVVPGSLVYLFAKGRYISSFSYLVASKPSAGTSRLPDCTPVADLAGPDWPYPSFVGVVYPERADVYRADVQLNWLIAP
jgi:hypothetical protein